MYTVWVWLYMTHTASVKQWVWAKTWFTAFVDNLEKLIKDWHLYCFVWASLDYGHDWISPVQWDIRFYVCSWTSPLNEVGVGGDKVLCVWLEQATYIYVHDWNNPYFIETQGFMYWLDKSIIWHIYKVWYNDGTSPVGIQGLWNKMVEPFLYIVTKGLGWKISSTTDIGKKRKIQIIHNSNTTILCHYFWLSEHQFQTYHVTLQEKKQHHENSK